LRGEFFRQMTEIKKIAQRIKYLREVLGMKPEEVATIAKVSVEDYLAAEDGKSDFSFNFLQRLAKCFSVDIVQLISGETPKLTGFQITRKGDGMELNRRKGFKYLHLASEFKDKAAEPFVVTVAYNPSEKGKPIQVSVHNDQEVDFVLKGKLRVRIGEYETVLNEGDSVYYNANLPHGMVAEGEDCTFLALVIKSSSQMSEILDIESAENIPAVCGEKELYYNFITPKLDDKGRVLSLDFHPTPDYNFAYDVVDALAKKSPDKLAMVWISEQKEEKFFTFKDLSEYSNRVANFFLKIGIKKGDKVLLVLKRRHQFWAALLALHKIGAIGIPATFMMVKEDYIYRINSAGITACVVVNDKNIIETCDSALKECSQINQKISVGAPVSGWLDFDSEVISYSSELERIPSSVDDIALMYFSSGTSGYPKIVSHTQKYTLGHFVTAKYWHNVCQDDLHFTIADTGWAKSVWGKMYGQWLSEAAVFVYDFDRFDATDILDLIQKYGVTSLCAPPTMLRLFDLAGFENYDLSCLKKATTAGEAMNQDVAERFRKATGIVIREGFGQTETTVMIANLPGHEIKPGSMGKPTPQYQIDLIDREGNSTKPGEVGEIVIDISKGMPYGLLVEYYNDPEGTKRTMHDGKYHTGDEAWRDEEGYYYFVGRVDDVIKSSGYRIGPFEIESVVMKLPYVLECAVTGVPDPERGQIVKASVVLKKGYSGSDAMVKEIQDFVKSHTAPYKYPRIVEFIKELPRTTNGKIRRVVLRNKDKQK
jgi:acetyl-CoA synthetase